MRWLHGTHGWVVDTWVHALIFLHKPQRPTHLGPSLSAASYSFFSLSSSCSTGTWGQER
jgi:hypothetical protein